MKRKIWDNLWIIALMCLFTIILVPITHAQGDLEVEWFNIMPELEEAEISQIDEKIKDIWSEWWEVNKKYYEASLDLTTSQQVAWWIMNRDTIMNYLVFIVQFLSQLWLVVWGLFIMYAWYKYIWSVFNWWKVPSETVKNAIVWILIVIFSYAIMKILTSFIWLS